VRVEVACVDGVIDIALLNNRITRHSCLDLLGLNFRSGLPFSYRVYGVIFRFKILDESVMEVRRRIRPENFPIVLYVSLQDKYSVVDLVQKFIVFVKLSFGK